MIIKDVFIAVANLSPTLSITFLLIIIWGISDAKIIIIIVKSRLGFSQSRWPLTIAPELWVSGKSQIDLEPRYIYEEIPRK